MDKKQEFLKKILETFKAEANENLNAMAIHLIELEKNPGKERQDELSEIIYRVAHSLKGASRSVNLSEIESICHAFEDVMSAIRDGQIEYNTQVFDALHQTIDIITELLDYDSNEVNIELETKISEHIDKLTLIEAGIDVEDLSTSHAPDTVNTQPNLSKPQNTEQIEAKKPEKEQSKIKPSIDDAGQSKKEIQPHSEPHQFSKSTSSQTIRISTDKLDNVLSQAEELLSLKLRAIQRTKNLQNTLNKFSSWHKESFAILQSANNVSQILKHQDKNPDFSGEKVHIDHLTQYLEWTNSFVKDIEKELKNLNNFSVQEIHTISLKIENLLDDVKELIAVPFSTLSDMFPKMVRDIAKDLGKEVDFYVEGDDIRIDRRILEKIRTPLIHILRNSIDYGIEKPEERSNKKKPPKGKVRLIVKNLENNKIGVYVSDDGKGIDVEKLKKIYIADNNIQDQNVNKITDKECLGYIFHSGVSTSDIVTDLSGRGLGLAIAWQEIQQIGGNIDVETQKNISTTFSITLPISIVTFRGIIVEISNYKFIIPTIAVHRVLRIKKEHVKTVEGKATILLEGEITPLVKLNEILQLKEKPNKTDYLHIAVFENNTRKIGFVIDKVINEQEVVVKNFNRQLKRIRNISGATILGSGEVVPILNVSDLFKSSSQINSSANTIDNLIPEAEKMKSVLVVDDSITSRTLLKNILNAAGYKVTTAIDGLEGYTKLKEGAYQVVISDVEMPKLDGFGLTSKIRADKEFSDMPVILVTSLSKREHREKGIDVGANAYIVKSSFDQTNLLDIIERLI
jgi:two-component system chemotaxis sensor kinase CheA